MIPGAIRERLERSPMYMHLRYGTFLYKLWLGIRDDVRKDLKAQQNLYQQILPHHCSLIVDIGANEGMTTEIFSQFSKRVIAVEPAKRNISILKAKFGRTQNITILPVAISDINGEQRWYEDKIDYAMGTLNPKWNDSKRQREDAEVAYIKTMTLDELIKQYGEPDYVKIDVEGNESAVLQGLTQPIPLLSFEGILPQFLEESIQCIEKLNQISKRAVFNYAIAERIAWPSFQPKEIILKELTTIKQTVDIFCRMQ